MNELKFNSVPQKWDDYEVLFVFSDDGLVSCRLSFYKDTPQDAVISDLYVHESVRKQGCATSIINWCIEYSKNRDCKSLYIRSDNDDWIRQWYERLGFKKKSSQVWFEMSINGEIAQLARA